MAGTILRMGWTDPRSDTFGAHPLLGAVFDLNDGVTFTLLDESLELEPPARELALAGNPRATGERATRAIYRHNRQARIRLSLGPMASYSDLVANIRALVRWVEAPPAVPITLLWQPPSASAPVYLDVVGAAHAIPADERDWLRLQMDGLELVFVTRPGLRGDRVTLSNLVVNPGFEAPSGPGVVAFNDTFATLNAYAVRAGSALAQESGPTYADAALADAPLCYYRLDEASGTTAYDAGSLAQPGTTHGAPTQGVAGLLVGDADPGYTLASASSQYVTLPTTGLPTGAAAFSIEAWVKFAANPTTIATIVWLGASAANKVAWLFVDTAGKLNFHSDGGTVLTTTAALATGVAHHVVATYDGASMRLYVDGALSVGPAAETFAITYSGGAASIGATATPNQFWNGQIDEVALYGAALSPTRVAAHYTAGTTAPAASAANTALLASGSQVSFGSPAWGPLNQWQTRLRWYAGATATFALHYTDASDYLAATVSGTQLALVQVVGGTTHTLGTTAAPLVNGVHYWLRVTQFPCAPGTPSAVQAQLFADGAGAGQGSVGAALSALLGPLATWDSVTALAGQPRIAVSGGALGLGGAYAGVHSVSLFGPGGWSFTPLSGAATAPASGAWEQAPATTYPGGAVTSFGAARIDLPPAGTVSAGWETYSGGAPTGSSAIPAASGQVVAASLYVRSTGLSGAAQLSLIAREWDASGALLRATTLQTLVGNQATWAALTGSLTLGATTAYVSLLAQVSEATAGASAGATVWLDNAQAWNVTTSGVAAGQMPYCELRFGQSPAQLLVTGLLGDLPAPAHLAWGTYLAAWPTGSTLTWALGRRAQASANARLVGSTLGYYGAALTPTSAPSLSAGAWGGFSPSVTMNPGWNPRAFSLVPADAAGVYHLFHRFFSAQSAGNLANLSVRVVTEQKSGAWYGALSGTDLLGAFDGPYTYAPLPASAAWTVVDAGQARVPAFPTGALTDLTQSYLTPRPQWADATSGGAAARCDWQALVPVDGSLLLGVVNNPANAPYAISGQWLWGYVDGLLANRAGALDAPSALTWSAESAPLSHPAAGAGGPGAQDTGAININSGADPCLTLDPTVICAAEPGGRAAGGAGVNQFVGLVSDQAGDVTPLHVEIQYSPLYLYPR